MRKIAVIVAFGIFTLISNFVVADGHNFGWSYHEYGSPTLGPRGLHRVGVAADGGLLKQYNETIKQGFQAVHKTLLEKLKEYPIQTEHFQSTVIKGVNDLSEIHASVLKKWEDKCEKSGNSFQEAYTKLDKELVKYPFQGSYKSAVLYLLDALLAMHRVEVKKWKRKCEKKDDDDEDDSEDDGEDDGENNDENKPSFITTLIYENFENLSQFTNGCEDKDDCKIVSGNCCQSGYSGVAFAILEKKKEDYWKTRFKECEKLFGPPKKLKCSKTGAYDVKVACIKSKCVTQPKTDP